MNNKKIIYSLLGGFSLVVVILFISIMSVNSDIKSQHQKNIIKEIQARSLSDLKMRYTTNNNTFKDKLSKEYGISKSKIGKKIVFQANDMKFKDFNRLANKILKSTLIIREFEVVKKSKDSVNLKVVTK